MPKTELKKGIVIVTVMGTTIGALLGWFFGLPNDGPGVVFMTLPVGTISSFLFCLVLSLIFTRIIEAKRNLKMALGLSLVFGAVAGAFSGATTGLSMSYAEYLHNHNVDNSEFLVTSCSGAVIGGFVGLILSILIWTKFIYPLTLDQKASSERDKNPKNEYLR